MSEKKPGERPLLKWAKKINWDRRVKSICKPCWEIKYCPYGPIVEEFALRKIPNEKSCRIFGHDCPVFYCAEPFTETKELRNISRYIPRTTQFKVLKRENQICSKCGNSIKDGDYEFDHIIPWAKGGSSEEYNIRLLCKECNRQKSNKFEDIYLIKSTSEHIIEPVGVEVLKVLKKYLTCAHYFFMGKNRYPNSRDLCKYDKRRKETGMDVFFASVITYFVNYFSFCREKGVPLKTFNGLKYRWGFDDHKIHSLQQTAQDHDVSIENLFNEEINIINHIGWHVSLTSAGKKKWLNL